MNKHICYKVTIELPRLNINTYCKTTMSQ